MEHLTFKPVSAPVYGVMKKAAFLLALDNWSRCEPEAFSKLAPPVDSLPDDTCDENAELAAVFYRLSRQEVLTDQMAVLAFELLVHQRRYELAWNAARGQPDPRLRADRTDWVQLKPYGQMIETLRDWADALHDRACEEVGP